MRHIVFAIIMAVTVTIAAEATTFYTSSTGSDTSNNCQTIGSPCDLSNGLAYEVDQTTATNGDILYMCAAACDGAGSVSLTSIEIDTADFTLPSGTTYANALTIAGYTGETVTLQRVNVASGAYIIFKDFSINSQGTTDMTGFRVATSSAHHIRAQNLEITAHEHGFLAAGGTNDVEAIDIHVYDSGHSDTFQEHCVYIEDADDVLVDGGEFEGCAFGFGVHVYNASPVPARPIIRNTIVHDSRGGILLHSTDGLAYNNIVYDASVNGRGISVTTTNNEIYNNTIFSNGWDCGDSSGSGHVFSNNICWGNSANYFTGSGATYSNNICSGGSSGCVSGSDPLFVNEGTFDFHLTAGSPALNAGVAVADVTTDFDGAARANPPDIGAYEFAGANESNPAIGVYNMFSGGVIF